MSCKNTEIGNCYIKSEAEVIAVKIQDFKRIPTIQYNIFISPLSSHINTERKRKQKNKHAENVPLSILSQFMCYMLNVCVCSPVISAQ